MGIKREALENGNVLRFLVDRFNKDQTDENFISVFRCLRDSFIWIPCNLEMSDADMEMFTNVSAGDVVKTTGDIKLVPDTLKNGDYLFLPVFSNCEQMGEDYGNHFSKVEKHFFEAMSMAMAREDICGIVLDAFSQPFIIAKDAFEFIGNLPSEIEKE